MIRKTVAMSLILAAGICAYRGSSPYIEARMEQEYLKQAAFPGNEGKLSEEDERKGNDPTREETVPYTSPIDFEALKSINRILLAGYRSLEQRSIIPFAGGPVITNTI